MLRPRSGSQSLFGFLRVKIAEKNTKKRTPQIQGIALTGTDSNQETNTSKDVLELRVDEAALSEYVGKPVAWSTENRSSFLCGLKLLNYLTELNFWVTAVQT